jgi:hypothetical protein
MHVWNRENFIPDITDMFNVFSTKAYFKDLIMPPADLRSRSFKVKVISTYLLASQVASQLYLEHSL